MTPDPIMTLALNLAPLTRHRLARKRCKIRSAVCSVRLITLAGLETLLSGNGGSMRLFTMLAQQPGRQPSRPDGWAGGVYRERLKVVMATACVSIHKQLISNEADALGLRQASLNLSPNRLRRLLGDAQIGGFAEQR